MNHPLSPLLRTLSPIRGQILRTLIQYNGEYVTKDVLAFAVWRGQNEPECTREALQNAVTYLRRTIEPHGWTVRSRIGQRGGYSLAKLDDKAEVIYVASPYTHPSPEVREQRYELAFRYTASLLQDSRIAFSPIVYGHEFAERGFANTDYRFWQRFNDQMLKASTVLHQLTLPGWRDSRGCAHERGLAADLGIHIEYIDYG